MDIDAEVGQAYHTVQLSTKEMLKNNRRQHYCNVSNFHELFAVLCSAFYAIITTTTIVFLANE